MLKEITFSLFPETVNFYHADNGIKGQGFWFEGIFIGNHYSQQVRQKQISILTL